MTLGILLAIFILNTVRELDLYLEESEIKTNESKSFLIESESIIDEREFNFFRNFIKENNKVLSTEKIKLDQFLVKEDFEYTEIFKNECQEIYCYQNKVRFENIPSSIWKGLIGIEDARFLNHVGVDIVSIFRALIADIKAMKIVQGGSTITQQLAKNLYLSNEKTFKRKFKEWVYAIYLEKKFNKDEILKLYFNEMEWGSLNGIKIKGIHIASIFFFSKELEMITPYEATILITMLKGPYFYHPVNHMERVRKRVDSDFEKLVAKNIFLNSESKWTTLRWESWLKEIKKKIANNYFYAIWHASKDKNTLLEPYQKYVFSLVVKNTLEDFKKQFKINELSFKSIITDTKCENCEKYYFYSSYERDLKNAVENEIHQVGSIFKPILYNFFVNEGYLWEDEVSTAPITLKLISGNWTPKDVSIDANEKITLEEALMRSKNIPTIRISNDLGFKKIEDYLKELIPELKIPLEQYPAQLLGAIELPLYRISEIYSSFIKDNCNNQKRTSLEVLADPKYTTIKNVVREPLKSNKFFGKTGTSNSGLDSWFVSFDGRYLSANWFGVDGNRENIDLKIGGATSSFKIYQNYIIKNGKRFNVFDCLSNASN